MSIYCMTTITRIALIGVLASPITLLAQEQAGAQAEKPRHHHYRAVDIPTFGGPASYINPASVFGSTNQINTRGTTVGAAATSIPTPPTANSFICFGPGGNVPFVYHAFEWLNGTTKDLGTLGGPAECSEATSVNAKGQIVGTSEVDEIDPVLGTKQVRAVLWENGKIKDLGTFGGNHSAAAGNNNRGQVVGFALNAIPDPFSFLYILLTGGASTGTQTRGFLWQNGELQDLGTLGGSDAAAFVVNERGQVAGVSSFNSEPNPITGLPNQHAFLWQNGTMTDLGSLGGASATPSGLNNRGQVIGNSTTAASEEFTDPYLWERGKLIDLFTETEGKVVLADAINDSGQVVGAGDFSSTGGSQFSAVLWQNGVAINLGTLNGDCYSEAFAINSRGQVVGHSIACDTFEDRAFLWENGTMIDLNEKVPPDFTLRLADAVTINDQGEIGGFGAPVGCDDAETCGRAFLLTPTGWENLESTSPGTPPSNPHSFQLPAAIAKRSLINTRNESRVRFRMARRPLGFGIRNTKSVN
jgi:probable HAF family extracellular repeat protein